MTNKVLYVLGSFVTLVFALLDLFFIRANRAKYNAETMRFVRENMGDQVAIKNSLTLINLELLALIIGLFVIIGLYWWYMSTVIKKGNAPKAPRALSMILLLGFTFVFTGCATEFVTVTPPNYALTINMDDTTDQAVGNDFSNAELSAVTRIPVGHPYCGSGSRKRCPDKLVIEVVGAPQSRSYTQDPTTGTSGADEAICFEASGVNGCVDFSISAIVLRDDAICYANKVGALPINDSSYHFTALSLAESLDTKVVQIASTKMVEATAEMNPLDLATQKFTIFNEVRPAIVEEVYEQTCITIKVLELAGGIQWGSPEVQNTIDDAVVLQNEIALAAQQGELDLQRAENMRGIVDFYRNQYGDEMALQILTIEKWDGSFMPPGWAAYAEGPQLETVATTQVPPPLQTPVSPITGTETTP